ncbi:MAG: hypothetical protein AAF580_07200 [Pseudomonadota bacterium]
MAFVRMGVRNLTVVAFMFLSLSVLIPSPAQAFGLGDLIYPGDEINENIDRLESAGQQLIRQFGDTIDSTTLLALNRALAGIQSARIALSDEMDKTLNAVASERQAILYNLASQLIELEKMLDGGVSELTNAERRFSDTLISVTRAARIPLVLFHRPQLFRPDRTGDISVAIEGQHLGEPDNRLIVGSRTIAPASYIPSRVVFRFNRNLLRPNNSGIATVEFIANRPFERGWRFWLDEPEPVSFKLDLKNAGEVLGRYNVSTTAPVDPVFNSREVQFSATSPDRDRRCIGKGRDDIFDPGHTRVDVLTNEIRVPEIRVGGVRFPPSTKPGTGKPYSIISNQPEQLCIELHAPAIRAANVTANTNVKVRVSFRIRTQRDDRRFRYAGPIVWDRDTVVELPERFKGFRAEVNFTGAQRSEARVFTGPEVYGPLEVRVDPQTRTLTFRPREVE